MQGVFRPCVQQEDIPVFQCMDESVIVEHLPLDSGYGRERQVRTLPLARLPAHCGGYLRLVHPRARHPVRNKMHTGAYVNCLLYRLNLLRAFMYAHIHHGLDETLIGLGGLFRRGYSQQFQQPYAVLPPVRRQESYASSLRRCLLQKRAQLSGGEGFLYPGKLGVTGQGWHSTRPDNVVYCEFVSKDYVFSRVQVHNGGKAGVIQAEVVQECTVLAERVCIVRIVHSHFPVAQEKQDAAARHRAQALPSFFVCLCAEHITGPCCSSLCIRSLSCAWKSGAECPGNTRSEGRTGPGHTP